MLEAIIILGTSNIGLVVLSIVLSRYVNELGRRLEDEIHLNEKLIRKITGER